MRLSGIQPFKKDDKRMSFRSREASVKNTRKRDNSLTGLTTHEYLNE